MKLIRLEAENIKCLKAIEINPDGDLVVIGGKNDQGKSTTLDCIDMAFSGASSVPAEPIRKGEESARILAETEDLIVTRTFTIGGGRGVRVGTKDGKFYTSPQAVLDGLTGGKKSLAFDPLAFGKMESDKQVAVLRELTGLDFTKIEEERAALYEKRTEVNRAGKEVAGVLKSITRFPDAPKTRVSVTDLMTELQRREHSNKEKHDAELKLERIKENHTGNQSEIRIVLDEIADLEKDLKRLKEDAGVFKKSISAQESIIAQLKSENTEEIKKQISSAEQHNTEVEAEEYYAETNQRVEALRKQSKKLSDKIAALGAKQTKQLAEAKFPIKGLSFDEDNVYFNGVPIKQLSTSKQIEVFASIGFAINPELRIMLVREGAALDADNRKLLAKLAKKNNTQLFLEVVGEGGDPSVIIEDGMVKGTRSKSQQRRKKVQGSK